MQNPSGERYVLAMCKSSPKRHKNIILSKQRKKNYCIVDRKSSKIYTTKIKYRVAVLNDDAKVGYYPLLLRAMTARAEANNARRAILPLKKKENV